MLTTASGSDERNGTYSAASDGIALLDNQTSERHVASAKSQSGHAVATPPPLPDVARSGKEKCEKCTFTFMCTIKSFHIITLWLNEWQS